MARVLLPLAALMVAACFGTSDDVLPPGYNLLETPRSDGLHEIAGLETARGSLAGLEGPASSGTASVIRAESGWTVSLARDVRLDLAPGERALVMFGEGGIDKAAVIGPLAAASGASVYPVPGTLDVGTTPRSGSGPRPATPLWPWLSWSCSRRATVTEDHSQRVSRIAPSLREQSFCFH